MLRTLIEAEVAARDASNERARLKAAGFPVLKTLEEFDLAASSIPAPTWAYLTSLEWIPAKENLALIGPAGTGKSHTPVSYTHLDVYKRQRIQRPQTIGSLDPRPQNRKHSRLTRLEFWWVLVGSADSGSGGVAQPADHVLVEAEVLFRCCLLYTSRCV